MATDAVVCATGSSLGRGGPGKEGGRRGREREKEANGGETPVVSVEMEVRA